MTTTLTEDRTVAQIEITILERLDRIEANVGGRLDKMDGRLDRMEDDLDTKFGAVLAETGLIKTEVRDVAANTREVATLQGAHDRMDETRFGALNSDMRELKGRVMGVEDTSRRDVVTAAQADVLAARTETAEYRRNILKVVVLVLLTVSGTLGAEQAMALIKGIM